MALTRWLILLDCDGSELSLFKPDPIELTLFVSMLVCGEFIYFFAPAAILLSRFSSRIDSLSIALKILVRLLLSKPDPDVAEFAFEVGIVGMGMSSVR